MLNILAALLLACQAQPDNDDFWYGPLGAKAHAVFQLAGVGFVPDTPTSLKEDTFELRATVSSINVFNNDLKHRADYLIDLEFERLELSAWYAISNKWQIGIDIPLETVNGGVLDNFIIGFHRTFGIDQGGRTDYKRNVTQILVGNNKICVGSDATLGDIMLMTNYKIIDDIDGPQWMVGAQLKLPTATGDILYNSRTPGFGLSTNVFHQIGNFYYNVGGSLALVGDAEVLDQRVRWYQATVFGMAEYQFIDGISIVAQLIGQSGLAKHFGQYGAWSWEADAGFKFQVSKGTMLQFGIFENAITYANSADFGVFASLVLRY